MKLLKIPRIYLDKKGVKMKGIYRIIFVAICLIVFNLSTCIVKAQTFKCSQNGLNSNKYSDFTDTGLALKEVKLLPDISDLGLSITVLTSDSSSDLTCHQTDRNIRVSYTTQVKTLKLNEYFGDLKGDKSTYELVETNGNTAYIEVLSIWKDYRIFIIIIVMAVTLLITIYKRLTVINLIHSEKMNLYFTQTPKGVELEPLTFLPFQVSAKKISLAELLEGAGCNIEVLDASHIYFEPGFNREIVFRHETKNTVMIGPCIACQKIKYSIAYGTKIYIISEDESYDLEIHFVPSRC